MRYVTPFASLGNMVTETRGGLGEQKGGKEHGRALSSRYGRAKAIMNIPGAVTTSKG